MKCFHCDVLLYEWEPEDDPFVEHARWAPRCQYILLIKGEDFVRDVQNGTVTQDDLMQKPAVLAVLYEGYSVESVQKALNVMKEKDGKTSGIVCYIWRNLLGGGGVDHEKVIASNVFLKCQVHEIVYDHCIELADFSPFSGLLLKLVKGDYCLISLTASQLLKAESSQSLKVIIFLNYFGQV